MTLLSDAKIMGGIGSILVILTVIPSYGWIVGVIGFILILVAMKYIADAVEDHRITRDMLVSVLLAIAAVIITGVTFVNAFYRLAGLGSFSGPDFVPGPNVTQGDWIGFALSIIPGLVIVWALFIGSAVFLRMSLDNAGRKLNVGLFGTAGLLYLIGAVTTVIAVGFILIFVAEILLAIAFFSIHEERLPSKPAQYA